MNTKPFPDRLIIKPDPKESNLMRPSGAVEELRHGTVIDSYQGCRFTKGDRIVYDIASGSSINIDGEEYLLIRMPDIFGKVEKQESLK